MALDGSFSGGTTNSAGFSRMVVGETGDELVLLFEINSELANGDLVVESGTVLATQDVP